MFRKNKLHRFFETFGQNKLQHVHIDFSKRFESELLCIGNITD